MPKNKSTKTKSKSKKKPKGLSYADSGVSIDANNEFVNYIFPKIKSTYSDRVQSVPGGFAALFSMTKSPKYKRNYRNPVLVACNDGVGSKLKLAVAMNKHDTVGIDCVAMNVNDMICLGAQPLFFLDYLGVHGIDQRVNRELIDGLVEGCRQSDCALVGGETSEMPDVYAKGDYDLVGFSVGVIEEGRQITGEHVKPGDAVIGLPSSGVHSNGFTLARKALFAVKGYKPGKKHKSLGGLTVGQVLLEPTKIYVKPIMSLLASAGRKRLVNAMANITGGGLIENIPRVLPGGCRAVLDPTTWERQPIFDLIQDAGNVDLEEMYRVFNMGIGYVLVVPQRHLKTVLASLKKSRTGARVIGRIEKGKKGVTIDGVIV